MHAQTGPLAACHHRQVNYCMLIANLKHFLTESGEVPADLPRPAERSFRRLAAIVAEYTLNGCGTLGDFPLTVPCSRRPGRKPCPGRLLARLSARDNSTIVWFCTACDDSGTISGWQHTQWDKRNACEYSAESAEPDALGQSPEGSRPTIIDIDATDLIGLSVLRVNDLYDFVTLWTELHDIYDRQQHSDHITSLTAYGLAKAFAAFVEPSDAKICSLVIDVLTKAGIPLDAAVLFIED
jgi:hypothetical protein